MIGAACNLPQSVFSERMGGIGAAGIEILRDNHPAIFDPIHLAYNMLKHTDILKMSITLNNVQPASWCSIRCIVRYRTGKIVQCGEKDIGITHSQHNRYACVLYKQFLQLVRL